MHKGQLGLRRSAGTASARLVVVVHLCEQLLVVCARVWSLGIVQQAHERHV